jgi:hypothetical protein
MVRWIAFDDNTATALASRRIDAELHTGSALQAALEFGGKSVVVLPAENGQALLLAITPAKPEASSTGMLGLAR